VNFRLFEFCWSEEERGFSFFSFLFPDDEFNAFLCMLHLVEERCFVFGIFFCNFIFDYEE